MPTLLESAGAYGSVRDDSCLHEGLNWLNDVKTTMSICTGLTVFAVLHRIMLLIGTQLSWCNVQKL